MFAETEAARSNGPSACGELSVDPSAYGELSIDASAYGELSIDTFEFGTMESRCCRRSSSR